MLLLATILGIIIALIQTTLIQAQSIPNIPCPNYFEYLRSGNQFIGRITLQLDQSINELNVKFSQQFPITSNYYGSLTLFDGEESTKANLRNGRPISYRVDFPTSNVVPRLVSIELNGEQICAGREYPPPNTSINLMHTLRSSTVFFSAPQNSRFPDDNVFYYDGIIQPYPGLQQPTVIRTRPNNNRPTFNIVDQSVRIPSNFDDFQPNFDIINQQNPFFTQNTPTRPRVPSSNVINTQVQSQERPQQPPTIENRTQRPSTVAPNVCGREGNTVMPFVHFGRTLARGQFPWLTAIYQKLTASGLKFICGGSLISRRTVITAAHCFKLTSLSANQVLIYLGRHNLDDYSENGILAREVQQLVMHPQYNTNTYPDADLALVQLQQPVEYTTYVQPICLWSERFDLTLPSGQRGTVAGWGGDENGAVITNLPKSVDAEIVSEAECLRSLEVKDLTSNRTLCAGNRDGSGPCMGDSGGGLMLNYNGAWILRGIVSAGQVREQRCNLNEYVIYCDVAKHITWVRENVVD